jgi:hyperosmotically inducible periplasmic protein
MSFRPAAFLCLIGAAAACSSNQPEAASADDVYQTNVAQSEPVMTPASLDTRRTADPAATPAAAPSTIGASDADADTKRASSNAATADATARNAPTAPGAVQPDNTKVNERDKSSAALTPLDQRENETDLKITQRVRQAVMANGTLSFTAKNVKIITQGGKVTLRGPVNSAPERDTIEAAARDVAGVLQVDNQIEVKK